MHALGGTWRYWGAEAALAGGDLAAARGWADEAVSSTTGYYLSAALTGRARVLMAQGEPKQAESDAHDALTRAANIEAYLFVPDILEVLADLAGETGSHREAARLFGAAYAIRQRIGLSQLNAPIYGGCVRSSFDNRFRDSTKPTL